MQNIRIYNIDLTVTANCNFNCTYCFEHEFFEHKEFKDHELFIIKMNQLLNSDFFKKNYDLLNIGFWGGEPTLNEKAIRKIYTAFKTDDRVKFFIYSNGYLLDRYMDIFEESKNKSLFGHPKFCVQVSYDGMPVHDIFRKTKKNKLTGTKIRNVIKDLWKRKIPSVIKSTISPEAFKYLPEAREDVLNLYKEMPENNFFRSDNYFPTIDYYNLEKYNNKEIEVFNKELNESLIKIAKEEIEFFKTNNKFFFSWFNPNKALCCAGRDMVCVNWDGNIFKCHGSMYDDKKGEHLIIDIKNESFITNLDITNKLHNNNFGWEPEECKNCLATFCLRCNPVKFDRSEKKDYFEKWRDYTTQPRLCNFYKINGKIVFAIRKLLQQNGG